MAQPATEDTLGDKFPKPGDLFIDRYKIEEVLNQGGFGCVYRARQTELKRSVAIKILRPARRIGFSDDKAAESRRLDIVAKRFEREAQLVSQLRDPHTVMMYDYGTTEDGLLYMVLEYVDGQPLSEVLLKQGAMPPERCVKIARQVLMSLQEAHALGMLHRDIKPPNIMLFDHVGRTDQVRVLDFGLAKSIDDPKFTADDPDLTDAEVLIGTPRYMSPEQIRGEKLAAATDIYSLGLVIYEMLVGTKAVTSTSTMNTLARHINDEPIQLPAEANVPPKLREIVDTMLQKMVEDRYETVDIVLREFEQWDEGLEDIVGLEAVAEPPEFTGGASEDEAVVDDSDLFGGVVDDESTELKDASAETLAAGESSAELDETFFSTELDEDYGADFTMEARRKDRKVRTGLAAILLLFLLVAGLWIASTGDEELELPEGENGVASETTTDVEPKDGEAGLVTPDTVVAGVENTGEEVIEENTDSAEFVFGEKNELTGTETDAGTDAIDSGGSDEKLEEDPENVEKAENEELEEKPRPRQKRKEKPTLKLRTLK